MIKREQKAFYNPYYKADKLPEIIPYEFTRKNKLYRKVQEYLDEDGKIKFVRYVHEYINGKYYECFDLYDLKVFVRYG